MGLITCSPEFGTKRVCFSNGDGPARFLIAIVCSGFPLLFGALRSTLKFWPIDLSSRGLTGVLLADLVGTRPDEPGLQSLFLGYLSTEDKLCCDRWGQCFKQRMCTVSVYYILCRMLSSGSMSLQRSPTASVGLVQCRECFHMPSQLRFPLCSTLKSALLHPRGLK